MQESTFRKSIEKGWSLRKIGRHYSFSRQTSSNLFKKFYGINYREYKKKMNHEKMVKEYEGKDIQKIFEDLERQKCFFLNALKEIYIICQRKNSKIKVRLVNNVIKEVWANGKRLLFKEYILKGKTPEEKIGFYRFRPPEKKAYTILIVALVEEKSHEYFIIPREALFPKKSVCLPTSEKHKSKYLIYKNNWNQIFL